MWLSCVSEPLSFCVIPAKMRAWQLLIATGLDRRAMGRYVSRKLQKGEAERDCELWTLSNGGGGVGKWCRIGERVNLITSHQA